MPTGIEWCDETFNPWHGCEKVSPACAHCYAEGQSNRFNGVGMWGAGHGFRFQSDDYWANPLQWARTLPAKLGRRPRVFCASMADVFEDRPELVDVRARLFDVIYETPELDWLLLTKRPENVGRMLGPDGVGLYAVDHGTVARPQPNVWIGVSVENARYTWRADVLRQLPAAVRFISAEPLLGSLFKAPSASDAESRRAARRLARSASGSEGWSRTDAAVPRGVVPFDLTDIDWVIAGGESGARARPSHPEWFREIREACIWGDLTPCYEEGCCEPPEPSQRPAFFFKQWGEWAPYTWRAGDNSGRLNLRLLPDAGGAERNGKGTYVVRSGKKLNGRHLDGQTWDEFPQSAAVPA